MDSATQAQITAAMPDRSSWVAANAGSGKTRVLTDRVARLLLRGTSPEKILCLTYTKAAAAEMQTRLFARLGKWAMMPDGDLRDELATLGEDALAIEATQLAHARTLFARALETPGGLKIQTIHAFCERLLRRFPLEAGVSPQFEVMEERQARQLQDEILEALALDQPAVFDQMAMYLSGDDPRDLLKDIQANRARFQTPLDEGALAQALEVSADDDPAALLRQAMAGYSSGDLQNLADVLRKGGGAHDCKVAMALSTVFDPVAPMADAPALALLEAVFLTSGNPRKTGTFPVKAARAIDPDALPMIEALIAGVHQARQHRLARLAFNKALALNGFARAYLEAYAAQKSALGRLDFDDLIAGTEALLGQGEAAEWVLFRLDGGIDHILVDEAQDTAPAQWRVIRALSAEFFTGEGAREAHRTIFVVGDIKQSIYSFQGADPAAFGEMQRHFSAVLDAVEEGLEQCDLLYSFRSAWPILALVDETFQGAADGPIGTVEHIAFHSDKPGRVDLWPFVEADEKPDKAPWFQPVDQPPHNDPALVLARRIAAEVHAMLGDCVALPGAGGRALRPGDFLILLRRRSTLFHGIIRALKAAGVPVAGADRLQIGAELAVKDLLALLRFLVTPGDDLSLAAVLRSPLGGVDEAGLFALAYKREGTLWSALQAAGDPALVARLRELRDQADFLRPYEVLERVLTRHGGRRALIARLGREAEDGINALLDQALAYEQVEAPSLTGFLGWIAASEIDIKRQFDRAGGQVRVMTVHGAKGLEAPVVILPDTAAQKPHNPPAVTGLSDDLTVWQLPATDRPVVLQLAEEVRRERAGEEADRLLYVAMTRAESWLILAGAGKNTPDCWYARMAAAMEGLGAEMTEAGRSLSHNWTLEPASDAADEAAPPKLPDWALTAGPKVPEKPKPCSPSALGGAHVVAGETPDALDEEAAKRRGSLLHLMLQHLPDHPPADWPKIARGMAGVDDEATELLAEAAAVLTAPTLSALFDPTALVEVPIIADIPGLGPISGQIDRLIITPEHILAVDFKSNRAVPGGPAEVPEAFLRQMGAYHAALAQIWPDRPITMALVWTRTATLMDLPQESVIAALDRAKRG